MRDDLIPSKLKNIGELKYKIRNKDNIAFISIVGCKASDTFEKAKHYLGKHLSGEQKVCPENLLICIFYQDEILWDKEVMIKAYQDYNDKKI